MPSWYLRAAARAGLTRLVATPGYPRPGLTQPIFIGRVNNCVGWEPITALHRLLPRIGDLFEIDADRVNPSAST